MPSERERLIGFLDAFQSAERAGAGALGRWIDACDDPRLRGGLRVIRARDERHAALALSRMRALGGMPRADVSRDLGAICAVVADPGVSDRSKLAILLTRLPADGRGPLADVARDIEEDAETRALLETIGEDERAGLAWLRHMRETLDREGR
jgi:hypothetical protein